jgi:hypothetical protein
MSSYGAGSVMGGAVMDTVNVGADKIVGLFTYNKLVGAVLIVLMVVAIIVLAVMLKKSKSGFVGATTAASNLQIPGMNPLWQIGSGDAGQGGSLDRAETNYHYAASDPLLALANRSGFPASLGPSCSGVWGADATQELQALAEAGQYTHDPSDSDGHFRKLVNWSVDGTTTADADQVGASRQFYEPRHP